MKKALRFAISFPVGLCILLFACPGILLLLLPATWIVGAALKIVFFVLRLVLILGGILAFCVFFMDRKQS